jgi:hypothetical protein
MTERGVSRPWTDRVIGLGIFLITLIVYNSTMTPSLSFKSPDGNELATVPYMLGLVHSTGYPLYTWLGKAFTWLPVGDVAHRMNLMSAVMGAGGVALLYAILLMMTRCRLTSVLAALLFAFSLTFWSQTGIAEVYAPNIFMLALTLYLLLRWAEAREQGNGRSSLFLLAFSFAFGLSLGTHMSNLGFAPAFVIFILLVDWRILTRPLELIGFVLLFLVGCAQFLWLPLQASTLIDAPMLRNAPVTLERMYSYTLGAFPQFKFAFPLDAIPERIVLYLFLLWQNFGLWGILLGFYGMAEMLWRDPKRFYLLILMYLAHVFFFVQYKVFDLDVFFIPSHLVYAIFMGYGAYSGLEHLLAFGRRFTRLKAAWPTLVQAGFALILILLIAGGLLGNWEVNDYSHDTAINDFYQNVFQVLPEESVLLNRGGVFGYDLFYFRYVYNIRPDIIMPMATGLAEEPSSLLGEIANASPIYTTHPGSIGNGGRTPWSPPRELLPPEAWYVPILVGETGQTSGLGDSRSLTLYQVTAEPPRMTVSSAHPQHMVEQEMEGLELVGYDLDDSLAASGGRFHLTLYWRVALSPGARIVTYLGKQSLESHALGFGNLERYVEACHPPRSSVLVEDYWVVVPSDTPAGSLELGVAQSDMLGGEGERLILGHLLVSEGG